MSKNDVLTRIWFHSAVGWQKRIKWFFSKLTFLQKTIYQDDAQVMRKFQTSTRPSYKDFGLLKNPEKGCQLKKQTDIRFCHKTNCKSGSVIQYKVYPVLSYNNLRWDVIEIIVWQKRITLDYMTKPDICIFRLKWSDRD